MSILTQTAPDSCSAPTLEEARAFTNRQKDGETREERLFRCAEEGRRMTALRHSLPRPEYLAFVKQLWR